MPDQEADSTELPIAVAPDLETLLDLETAIDGALAQLIQAEDVEQVAVRRGLDIITSRRVDVLTTIGAGDGTLYMPADLPDGDINTDELFERSWQARISLNVVTARAQNDAFHALYRARVRSVMLRFGTLFTRAVLPYHALSLVRSAGTQYGLVTAKQEDYSRLDYTCLVSIRDGVWPAPYGSTDQG